jgi:hypothetical protein
MYPGYRITAVSFGVYNSKRMDDQMDYQEAEASTSGMLILLFLFLFFYFLFLFLFFYFLFIFILFFLSFFLPHPTSVPKC